MNVDGSCHCGHITFTAKIDPDAALICHCTDCQALSASAYRTALPTAEADVTLLSGKPKDYIKTAESGRQRVQAFCPECGTALYATSVGDGPRTLNLRIGALRQRAVLAPRRQIWHRSALPWTRDLSDLPAVDTQ